MCRTTPPVSTPSRLQATLRSAIRFVSPVRRPPIRASVSWLRRRSKRSRTRRLRLPWKSPPRRSTTAPSSAASSRSRARSPEWKRPKARSRPSWSGMRPATKHASSSTATSRRTRKSRTPSSAIRSRRLALPPMTIPSSSWTARRSTRVSVSATARTSSAPQARRRSRRGASPTSPMAARSTVNTRRPTPRAL